MSRRKPHEFTQAPVGTTANKQMWRTLDEAALLQTDEGQTQLKKTAEAEMPGGFVQTAGLLQKVKKTVSKPVSRRGFMQLSTATAAAVALEACRRPVENILPYAQSPEGLVPGIPATFATVTQRGAGDALGILVTSHDGRPTKVEGNPRHPSSRGKTDPRAQAFVWDLYDPDRLQGPSEQAEGGHESRTFAQFDEAFGALIGGLGSGAGLRVLTPGINSPTMLRVIERAQQRFPGAKFYQYDSVNDDNARAGAAMAFGQARGVYTDLSRAKVVLSLDSDFLGVETSSVRNAVGFSARRHPDSARAASRMSRLYVAESNHSITGASSDHRFPLNPAQVEAFARAVGAALSVPGVTAPAESPVPAATLEALVADLRSADGQAAVLAGRNQPAHVHAIALGINAALNSLGRGKAVQSHDLLQPAAPSSLDSIRALATEIEGATALLILGGNPVYDAPADVDMAAILAREDLTSIYLGHNGHFVDGGENHSVQSGNETGQHCSWQVPLAHELETWGDQRAVDGTLSVQQPLIAPLWGGRSAIEILARLAGERNWRGDHVVKQTFRELTRSPLTFERDWRATLHAGVVAGTTSNAGGPNAIQPLSLPEAPSAEGIQVQFVAEAAMWDGRHANNIWAQELAHPMTKIVWDNAALVSRTFAVEHDLANQEVITITQGDLSIEAPVWVLPGHADGSITLSLGYGRARAGRYGSAPAEGRPSSTYGGGFRVEGLRTAANFYGGAGFSIDGTGDGYNLVQTQTHSNMEGRPIAIDATVAEYQEEPEFGRAATVEFESTPPLWRQVNYNDQRSNPDNEDLPEVLHKWGMVIDLSSCTGCNVCTVACQAENNIPSVGKREVERGREMTWMRIDRYYVGDPHDPNPQVALQPIGCQHCEEAPCENVCPVNATAHSPEGLNDMAYNRCIGTRYCANNCPYKVRRFNYLDWHVRLDELDDERTGAAALGYRRGADVANFPHTRQMQYNPNVTVRMRGVMEKCSYCVQRIQQARISARRERRQIPSNGVVTACQAACPSQAITFGDLNDGESNVSRLANLDRRYKLLAEVGAQPRTTFLGKIRNPNPALATADTSASSGTAAAHDAGTEQEAH